MSLEKKTYKYKNRNTLGKSYQYFESNVILVQAGRSLLIDKLDFYINSDGKLEFTESGKEHLTRDTLVTVVAATDYDYDFA